MDRGVGGLGGWRRGLYVKRPTATPSGGPPHWKRAAYTGGRWVVREGGFCPNGPAREEEKKPGNVRASCRFIVVSRPKLEGWGELTLFAPFYRFLSGMFFFFLLLPSLCPPFSSHFPASSDSMAILVVFSSMTGLFLLGLFLLTEHYL